MHHWGVLSDDKAVTTGNIRDNLRAREEGGDFEAETLVDFQIEMSVGTQEGVGPTGDSAVELERIVVGNEEGFGRLEIEDVGTHGGTLAIAYVGRIGDDDVELRKAGRRCGQHIGREEDGLGAGHLEALPAGIAQGCSRKVTAIDHRFRKLRCQGPGDAPRPGTQVEDAEGAVIFGVEMPGQAGHDGGRRAGHDGRRRAIDGRFRWSFIVIEVIDNPGDEFLGLGAGNQTPLTYLEPMATKLSEAQHILQRPSRGEFVQCRQKFRCPVKPSMTVGVRLGMTVGVRLGKTGVVRLGATIVVELRMGIVVELRMGIGDVFIRRYAGNVLQQTKSDGFGLGFRIERRQSIDTLCNKIP